MWARIKRYISWVCFDVYADLLAVLTWCAASKTVSSSLITRGLPRKPWNPCFRQSSRVACAMGPATVSTGHCMKMPLNTAYGICVGSQGDNVRLASLFAFKDFGHRCMAIHDRHLSCTWRHQQSLLARDHSETRRTCKSIRIKSYLAFSAASTASAPFVATATKL